MNCNKRKWKYKWQWTKMVKKGCRRWSCLAKPDSLPNSKQDFYFYFLFLFLGQNFNIFSLFLKTWKCPTTVVGCIKPPRDPLIPGPHHTLHFIFHFYPSHNYSYLLSFFKLSLTNPIFLISSPSPPTKKKKKKYVLTNLNFYAFSYLKYIVAQLI